METEIYKAPDGSWTAPIPFRRNRQRLLNNKSQALKRAQSLDVSLRKNPEKMEHVIAFMRKILENGHAEPAQHLDSHAECWYLPLFAVYHPKKPGSVRCVFDSSAKYEGISLNDVLLTGPDSVNSLLGMLLRFKHHPVAVTTDIEQMFYRFSVPEKHRELPIFSDASQRAISAIAYLKMYSINGYHHVSFIHGKAKVAPSQGHTITRLESCAAVLATKHKDTMMQHLSIPIDSIAMYTDSRVVLGYINNEHRRFYVYVGNRVDMIRHSTTADQWNYVSSEDNPADIGTRSIPAGEIGHGAWLQRPSILKKKDV